VNFFVWRVGDNFAGSESLRSQKPEAYWWIQ
jgi:hypothetical protein